MTLQQLQPNEAELIARGRLAWIHIQEDRSKRRALSRGPSRAAKERREQSQQKHRRWWLDVGTALMVGKRVSRTDRAYSIWIQENGFGKLARKDRSDAIWLVKSFEHLGELPPGLATPSTIRQWTYSRRQPSTETDQEPINETQDFVTTTEHPEQPQTAIERARGAWAGVKAELNYIHRTEWRRLGAALREIRMDFFDDAEFSKWCTRHGLKEMRPGLRVAAMKFSARSSNVVPFEIREWHRNRLKRPKTLREREVVTAEYGATALEAVKRAVKPEIPEEVTVALHAPAQPETVSGNQQIAAMLLGAAEGLQRSAALMIQAAQALQSKFS